VKHDAALALLGLVCLCQTLCVVGVLWMRDGFDQLHFSSASSTVGLFALAGAVALTGFSSVSGTIDCLVALALTFVLNPVMTSATARAGRRMRYKSLDPQPREFEQQP
jgi:monovalent cation/proton antiporter MnhG/PhaG subunit